MNLGPLIKSALGSVASGKVYPLIAPDEPPDEYIVYQEIARPVRNALSGKSNLQESRVQLDCFAKTYLQAHAIAEAAVTAMLAQTHLGSPTSFTATHIGQQDLSEPDLRVYRVMLEFTLFVGGVQ